MECHQQKNVGIKRTGQADLQTSGYVVHADLQSRNQSINQSIINRCSDRVRNNRALYFDTYKFGVE